MKILLSGGWGYGNLGDDAILCASMQLLREVYPEAEIVLFSYDVGATRCLVNDRVKLCESVHRTLFGRRAFRQLSIYKKSNYLLAKYHLLERIHRKCNDLYRFICPKKVELEIDYSKLIGIEEQFKDADVFVMSGGGYFNNWEDSLIARTVELRLAQKYNLRNYIMGQTLDDFHPQYRGILKDIFSKVTAISVRDNNSCSVLSSLDAKAIITPDLVLSGLDIPIKKEQSCDIVFIPAELPIHIRENIVDEVSCFVRKRSLRLRIAITRLYNSDIVQAKWCLKRFRRNGIDAEFRIPDGFMDIWNDISGVKYIVSRNLHGLILGYIGGGSVLSLNSAWKFEGFMEQIGHSDAIIDCDKSSIGEMELKLEYLLNADYADQKRMGLREQVRKCFSLVLNEEYI